MLIAIINIVLCVIFVPLLTLKWKKAQRFMAFLISLFITPFLGIPLVRLLLHMVGETPQSE
ncbi:hypothetical protein DWW69_14230 [Bacteroides sp. AF16-49]|jgi:hypothetical protein|nr:hypothetical protein DXB63_15365 [Bacteroides sp. OM05-12]RHR73817.1 hypothetical protein DWW69_14230 [Bacteroides sp. AF16-49]DAO79083.1 MAG TPA: hypothetical protein [Phycodnaviridae sp.]